MIAEISLWRDCGFMEGAINVPSATNVLTAPDLTVGEVRIPSARLFDTVRVPVDYLEVCNMTYLQMVINDADTPSQTRIFYGWVDNVSVVSDSPNAVTEISWHVDQWRTWLPSAIFGEGVIVRKRVTSTEFIPPQPYPYAVLIPTNERVLIDPSKAHVGDGPSDGFYWVYATISKARSGTVSGKTICFPISKDQKYNLYSSLYGEKFPSFHDVIDGLWDERLGLDPKTIKGAFICPYAPSEFTTEYYVPSTGEGAGYKVSVNAASEYSAVAEYTYLQMHIPQEISWSDRVNYKSTDTRMFYLCGFDGEVVGSVPWGFHIGRFFWRVIVSTSAAYVQVRAEGYKQTQRDNAHSAGLCWTVPMIPLEITENAASSYVYSGARQADIDQIVLNADKSRFSGHLGTVTGAATGAITGAMSTGNPIGAAAGAGIGAVANIVSTELSYGKAVGEFMDREISIRDYRTTHQSNGLIMAGGGFDFIAHGSAISFDIMKMDAYSEEVRERDMNFYGAHVHITTDDCSTIVSLGGPLQIENLHVTGPIPNTARRYIAERFKAGVYLND